MTFPSPLPTEQPETQAVLRRHGNGQLPPAGRTITRTTKIIISIAFVLMSGSILVTGVFSYLLSPVKKVLVVTMVQESTEADRQQLKDDCGGLSGIKVVKDQGNPSPRIQGRFPVRFDLGKASADQEAALEACVNKHTATVRGFLDEGDN